MKHKYKVYDRIITTDNHVGVITALQTSVVDNTDIPSYWVQYGPEVHPDGYARNTWESSIVGKVRKRAYILSLLKKRAL
jgi:hypothetical protein